MRFFLLKIVFSFAVFCGTVFAAVITFLLFAAAAETERVETLFQDFLKKVRDRQVESARLDLAPGFDERPGAAPFEEQANELAGFLADAAPPERIQFERRTNAGAPIAAAVYRLKGAKNTQLETRLAARHLDDLWQITAFDYRLADDFCPTEKGKK